MERVIHVLSGTEYNLGLTFYTRQPPCPNMEHIR
jgi:hypothetical protein